MKKFDTVLLKAFLYELPILVLYFISLIFDLEKAANTSTYAKVWYEFGGCVVFGSWMVISLLLSFRLMMSAEFRERVLSKITFLKERDEREIILTGQAAKTTMLTTLAVLIFLFCLSCFQVSVYRVPPEQVIDGKNNVLALNLNFDLINISQCKISPDDTDRQDIVSYTGLPIPNSSIIIGLICWQIIAYNYLMRRAMK
jgi:hypothetical protein